MLVQEGEKSRSPDEKVKMFLSDDCLFFYFRIFIMKFSDITALISVSLFTHLNYFSIFFFIKSPFIA